MTNQASGVHACLDLSNILGIISHQGSPIWNVRAMRHQWFVLFLVLFSKPNQITQKPEPCSLQESVLQVFSCVISHICDP